MTVRSDEQAEENVSKVVYLQNIKQSTLAEQGFQPPEADFNCGNADSNHACVDFNVGVAPAGESGEQVRSGEQVQNSKCEVRSDEQADENVSKVVDLQNGGEAPAGEKAGAELQDDKNVSKVINLQKREQVNENVSKVVDLQNEKQEGAKNEEGRADGDFLSDFLALHSQGLASLEAELAREREARALCESRLLCIGLLDEQGLPRELGDYLATSDADETEKRVKCVAQIIKNAVNEAVRARLETIKTPSRGKAEITKREFRELSLADMQRLYVTDKELYRTLTGKNN